MGEQLHTQHPSHDDTMHKKCYLRDFKKVPNENSIDILMQTLKDLFVTNSRVSMSQ